MAARKISAKSALTANGWRENVVLSIDDSGRIADIKEGGGAADYAAGVLLPALSNVHSHSFQRAMAGLAEMRGDQPRDDFWTWRKVMYRFLEILTPEDIGVIAAQVQMEMLEAGYASQAEFHYLHHGPGGARYEQHDELSLRHIEAANHTGIGYTHLPVLYMQGGLDGRPLEGGQLRFGCEIDEFEKLYSAIGKRLLDAPQDFDLGVAPHSLRAVTRDGLGACLMLAGDAPYHIHAAEQTGEIEEVLAALGARPVRWLLDNMPVDGRWCLIHATHLDQSEVDDLAKSGAIAGLCPITEANLGDGIFNASSYLSQGGAFGVGSDSNVIIGLSEELRMLEVTQRLRDRRRVVLADKETRSNGRYIYERAAHGGAQAIGRNAGKIEIGALADFTALNHSHHAICGLSRDQILDAWIFSGADDLVTDVWSAGRHVVAGGVHKHRDEIQPAFAAVVGRLRGSL